MNEMMQTLIVGGLVGFLWVGSGAAMIALPLWWQERMRRALADPLGRLLLTQGMILSGLLLFLGAAPLRGARLWASLGVLTVVKGLVLLGLPGPLRARTMAPAGRSAPDGAGHVAGRGYAARHVVKVRCE
jgi:hypothetical protein